MGFDQADYRRASARLDVPIPHVKAMSAVESSGETFWDIDGQHVVPVRFEAHWFGKLTGYRFNSCYPDLSCVDWIQGLAAATRAGAWNQVERARALDRDAADSATSWGAFQVMGFHWQRLRYDSVRAFVFSMSSHGDDGQMEAFVRFVEADPSLHRAMRLNLRDVVEQLYNGGGFGGAYAQKRRAAVAVFSETDAPATPRALRLGDRGPDVAAVQAALGVRPDGDFGPQTDAAVRLFQGDMDLVVDGIVGKMTRATRWGCDMLLPAFLATPLAKGIAVSPIALGSRLNQAHQMTMEAMAIAAAKFAASLSYRVAMRRQSLSLQNIRSIRLRCL